MCFHALSEKWGPEAFCRQSITLCDADLVELETDVPRGRSWGDSRGNAVGIDLEIILFVHPLCLRSSRASSAMGTLRLPLWHQRTSGIFGDGNLMEVTFWISHASKSGYRNLQDLGSFALRNYSHGSYLRAPRCCAAAQ
ncbi:hypothetical protein C8R43DRAFT_1107692 [Mycena crocata]|nr:hypothetical protein C8R43DRAFT_1107692 [Mycena crocata]